MRVLFVNLNGTRFYDEVLDPPPEQWCIREIFEDARVLSLLRESEKFRVYQRHVRSDGTFEYRQEDRGDGNGERGSLKDRLG